MPGAGRPLERLDARDPRGIVRAREAEGPAFAVDAARAPDAVHVDLRVGRDLDVDDRLELGDVEAARGDVRRDEDRGAAARELHEHLIALALLEIAVQGQGDEAALFQERAELAAASLRVAEGERALGPEVLEQERDRSQALALLDAVEALADLRGRVALGELHLLRLAQELSARAHDLFGERGREEQRLALRRTALHDRGDVVEEAHVEHAIRLVEHERLERRELQAPAREVVEDAAGRADDDVGAVLEARELRPDRRAAAQGEDLDVVARAREAADLGAHLLGELARRAQDEGLRAARGSARAARARRPPSCRCPSSPAR